MESAVVSWERLAEQARGALDGCSTVRARVRVKAPAQGVRGDAVESVLDVAFARPDMWRVDRDGELVVLRDGLRQLIRAESGSVQLRRRDPEWVPGDEIGGLGWGHRDLFRDPPAFEEPVSGPVPADVGGREAWEVRLAAPGRKPYVLSIAVDHDTGLVLRYAAEGTPYITEVLELVVNEELPADTFTWAGEVEDRRRVEREEADAGDVLDEMPLPRFWPVEPSWRPVHVDASTGAFQARLSRWSRDVVVARRPVRATEEWEVEGPPHRHEWVDGEWRWMLLAQEPLSAEDLARIRASIR